MTGYCKGFLGTVLAVAMPGLAQAAGGGNAPLDLTGHWVGWFGLGYLQLFGFFLKKTAHRECAQAG